MSDQNTILIAGLGNPGPKYEGTPHNAGFLVIDKLLETYGQKPETSKKLDAQTAKFSIADTSIILAKPATFMNESGTAVKKMLNFYNLDPSSLWIVHDEIDLVLGNIKIIKNRGSAGHKGIEDIMLKIGAKDFVRFRIGILPAHLPKNRSELVMNKFVVSKFSGEEKETFQKSIDLAKDAIIFAIENGVGKSASIYNSKAKDSAPSPGSEQAQ